MGRAREHPGPGRTSDFASAQVSSRTRTSQPRVRLETCALAKNGDAVSRPGCGRGGPGPPAPSGRSWDFSGEKGSPVAAAFEEVTGGAPSSSTSTDPGYGASEEGAREIGDMARQIAGRCTRGSRPVVGAPAVAAVGRAASPPGVRGGASLIGRAAVGVPARGPRGRSLSKSVAKAPIAPERRKRNVDIPRFFSRPIPSRRAFATDLDKLRPGPSQESHASHWAGRRFTAASLNGE